MIPNLNNRALESSGITASASFGISSADSAHIMTILRDTLYSDKVLAVLREYGSNAWDAHREAGLRNIPITITLPMQMDPTLTIQDHGLGLSHEAVFQVYTQYGASTKRNSDDAVGMLGIGSKSGFAYSDSFTITACHGGTRRTYVAVLDESEKGSINLLDCVECPLEETGVTIQIPIRVEDIGEFHNKAKSLFQFFDPLPEINIPLPARPKAQATLKHGVLYEDARQDYGQSSSRGWVAVMGCVPYRVNMDQLRGVNGLGGIGDYAGKLSGVLFFEIGDVQVSASREELKYNALTKAKIIEKFDLFIEEYVRHAIAVLEGEANSIWEKRVRAQVLTRLGLPIPGEFKNFLGSVVKIEKTEIFHITQGEDMKDAESIRVSNDVRLLIKDDARSLTGYRLGERDYVVRPIKDAAVKEVEKDLTAYLKKVGLTGVPILKMSELVWHAPWVDPKKVINVKHKVNTFKLISGPAFGHPWSDHWTVEDRVPTKDDVFVLLNGFKEATNAYNFYHSYREDRLLALAFGGEMPVVYGYKSTLKKPVKAKKCEGKEYVVWRKTFPKSLLTPEVKKWLSAYEWNAIVSSSFNYQNRNSMDLVEKALKKRHPITKMLRKQHEAEVILRKLAKPAQDQLRNLSERIFDKDNKSEAGAALDVVHKRYPLLAIDKIKLDVLWGPERESWSDYIKLIDVSRPIGEEEDDV